MMERKYWDHWKDSDDEIIRICYHLWDNDIDDLVDFIGFIKSKKIVSEDELADLLVEFLNIELRDARIKQFNNRNDGGLCKC